MNETAALFFYVKLSAVNRSQFNFVDQRPMTALGVDDHQYKCAENLERFPFRLPSNGPNCATNC
jgi:hypothetical protein